MAMERVSWTTAPGPWIDVTDQLPLALRWPRHQRFDQFVCADNTVALAGARRAACDPDAPWIFLAGPHDSGKTHLLVAACHAAAEAGRRAQYLPLARLGRHAAQAMRASSGCQLVVLDDVQAMVGDDAAEHAFFGLYNRARAEGSAMLFASRETPAQLQINLPDLRSRLAASTLARMAPLDESARRQVLRARAAARGIELDDGVLDWLFRRHARDLGALQALLEDIDSASLAAHRRVTIPFLRELLRDAGERSVSAP